MSEWGQYTPNPTILKVTFSAVNAKAAGTRPAAITHKDPGLQLDAAAFTATTALASAINISACPHGIAMGHVRLDRGGPDREGLHVPDIARRVMADGHLFRFGRGIGGRSGGGRTRGRSAVGPGIPRCDATRHERDPRGRGHDPDSRMQC